MHLSSSQIVPPPRVSSISLLFRIRTIRLVPILIIRFIFRFLHGDFSVYRLYIFPFLAMKHYLSSVHCFDAPLLFSATLFLETALPATIFLPF